MKYYYVVIKDLNAAKALEDIKEFETEVTKKLNDNWELVGGVSIAVQDPRAMGIAQALVKEIA